MPPKPKRDKPKQLLRVVIYARVSTDDAKQSESCDNQIARCKSYCEVMSVDNVERVIVSTIKDDGVSAKNMDRPGWKQVEELLKNDQADLVLSTSLDRMTRSVVGFLKCVEDVFDPYGKQFATLSEQFDTSSAAGRMTFHMLLVLAQFMREQTAEKVSATRQLKASNGYQTTITPFGTMPGDVKGVPEKDPDRWPWLELIFQRAAEGVPDHKILQELKENNVKTIRGASVGKTTLPRLLGNRFFLGEVCHDNVWYPAKHKCIIDSDLWHRAQVDRHAKRGPNPKHYIYILDNLLVTSHYRITHPARRKGRACPFHTRYTKNRHGTIYFNYTRADKLSKIGGIEVEAADDKAHLLPAHLNAEEIETKVVSWLIDASNKGALSNAIREARLKALSDQGAVLEQIKGLERQIVEAGRKRAALNRQVIKLLNANHLAAIDAVNEELSELKQQIESMTIRKEGMEAAHARIEAASEEMDGIDDNAALIRQAWESGNRDAVRNLLNAIIDEIDVRVDGILIKVFALPGGKVYELEPMAAPTGLEPVFPP